MTLGRLASLTVVFLAAACTPPELPGQKLFLEEFDCDKGPFAAALPREISKLRKFAPLSGERVVETQDWETYKAITRRLDFGGLVVHVITFTDGRPFLLSGVHVDAPQWRVTGPLRVGEPAAEFFKKWGKSKIGDGVWNISQLGATELFLEVKDGKIKAVNYACYTG